MRDIDKYAPKAAALIATRLVQTLIAHDEEWTLTVNDGEEDTLAGSRDAEEVLNALATTDHDYIRVYVEDSSEHTGWKCKGWVMLIWSNAGDVISDYTTCLDDVLTPVIDYAETILD